MRNIQLISFIIFVTLLILGIGYYYSGYFSSYLTFPKKTVDNNEKIKNMKSLIESINSNTKYFFTNEKDKTYSILLVLKNEKATQYELIITPNIPFQTTPLDFEKIEQISNKVTDKKELYALLDKAIEQRFKDGQSNVYLGTNEYYDEEEKYISDVTAGVPYHELTASGLKAVYNVENDNNTFTRYDLYDNAIKVSTDRIENNVFTTKESYVLWYPNISDSTQAVQSILDAKKTKRYSLEEFKNYVESFDSFKRVELKPDEIIFEHLIKSDSFISKKLSGLSLPLSYSKQMFDPTDIEEGRIYFWIEKNIKNILKSKIHYFVLQNRKENAYIIDSCLLEKYNQSYFNENYLETTSMSDEIDSLQERMSKDAVEISQEEIIEILTGKKASEVLLQSPESTIYLDGNIYDLYKNMVQHWGEGSDKEEFTNHTLFFKSKKLRDKWIKQELASKKSEGYELTNKKSSSNLLQHYQAIQTLNKKYLKQKLIKQGLLAKYPHLKEKLDGYKFKNFMKYSLLKIIEGDYIANESLLLNADKTSLIITGDLIVNGTLTVESKEDFYSDNYLVVLGNTKVDNYVHDPKYRFMLFAKDFLVKNISYLPAASRSWYISIKGKHQADILIHAQKESVKDKDQNIIFNHEYSTTNKKIFVDGFFDKKGRTDETFIFNRLKDGKSLLRDNLNQTEIDNDLLLTAFKYELNNWHNLYYRFSGFELKNLEIGEHYGHHIESDQIVEDIRNGTGMYLMSHDDYSLELVKAEKPLEDNELSSKNLAYRYFWIMWTFSDWKHRNDGPMDHWKTIKQIDTVYKNGIPYFKKDPHLALYWIMHFGLLEDKRYEEIKELMKDSDHSLIKGAFLFFDELKEKKTFPIEIDYKQDDTLFRKRIEHHKAQIKKAKENI